MVRAVRTPGEVVLDFETVSQNALLALLLILLIAFPSDLFNSTLLANYDEVRGWMQLNRIDGLADWLRRLPSSVTLMGFAFLGALVSSQMSPDFGFNEGSLALVLGLFLALMAVSWIYDVLRGSYMRRRFSLNNTLAAHPVGLVIAVLFVIASRAAHFQPGYLFGLFTALRFEKTPDETAEGRGLAVASIGIGILGFAAWFAWSPVKTAATENGAAFVVLVADAALSCFWVVSLCAIAFGLVPMRFMYGESMKKWNPFVWRLLWGLGMFAFVSTILHPENGFYGGSKEASLASVLALFVGFGVFSVLFWGYFRYRYIWRHTAPEAEGAVEQEHESAIAS